MYLARKVDDKLENWKETTNDILVIQGAPFVGKTATVRYFVDCYFSKHFFVDLESDAGKEFIKMVEDNNFTIQKVIYFAASNEVKFEDSSTNVLILKNIQSYEKIEEALAKLSFGYFRIICTLEDSIKNHFDLLSSINVTTIQMTTLTFEEFLGYYNAEEDYVLLIDTLDLQEKSTHSEVWFNDALEVFQNVGSFPAIADTCYNNGDWETEMEEYIAQLCEIISKRIGVSFTTVESTLSIVTKLALAKNNTFEDIEVEVWDYARRFNPGFPTDDAVKVVRALLDYDIISICSIYSVKKQKLLTDRYKVYFCDYAVLKALAKLTHLPVIEEATLLDNFIFSTYYKENINKSKFNNINIFCVEKKNKSIGFLLKSQCGYLPKFITTGTDKIPATLRHDAFSVRYYQESKELIEQDKKGADDILPLFALAKTILEGVNNNNPSSLPDLEKKNIITE